MHCDQNLALLRNRLRHLPNFDDIRRSIARADSGSHDISKRVQQERNRVQENARAVEHSDGSSRQEFHRGRGNLDRRERDTEQKRQRAVADADDRMNESGKTGQHLGTDRLGSRQRVFVHARPYADQVPRPWEG